MGLRIDLAATAADTASVHRGGSRAAVTEQGLRETRREQTLADAIHSMKEIGMRETVARDSRLQQSFGSIMADDVCERHRLIRLVSGAISSAFAEARATGAAGSVQ
jgi:very-short-patch-repair endonuclease